MIDNYNIITIKLIKSLQIIVLSHSNFIYFWRYLFILDDKDSQLYQEYMC
jgi:DUF971 family protein